MNVPQALNVALKEWHVVCRALESGRQVVLLRKGGIYESAGEFEVEHRRFLLFPTYLHQKLEMLKPEAHEQFEPRSSEPDRIELRAWCEVCEIIEVASRRQMDALDPEHIWTSPLIDLRLNYRPENPLYLLIVRTHVLDRPVSIQSTIAYAGCKSWVPLERSIDVPGARPALPDQSFEQRRARIHDVLSRESEAGT